MTTLINAVTALQGRLDQLLNNPRPDHHRNHHESISLRTIKLDFPRCTGSDSPEDWLFKANEFFFFHETLEEQRLTISSFHMDGATLSWFQWMRRNQQLTSWTAFSDALITRFGRTPYSSPQGALAKLTQTSSLAAYQSEFEALANQTVDLPTSFFTDCFIEGLRPKIRRTVKSFNPKTFSEVVGLAKLQEEASLDSCKYFSRPLLPKTNQPPPTAAPVSGAPTVPVRKSLTTEMSKLARLNVCVFIAMRNDIVAISARLENYMLFTPMTTIFLNGTLTTTTIPMKTSRPHSHRPLHLSPTKHLSGITHFKRYASLD